MADIKHWVITGASRGIGFEMVKQLVAGNSHVTAIARNAPSAKNLQKLLLDFPDRLRILEADVTKESEIDRAMKVLDGKAVDVLVNNAGVYDKDDNPLEDLNPNVVERTFQVNSLGPLKVTKIFWPLLEKSKQPIVANITSLMGSISDNSSGGSYAYRMSKAALNMFTKTLSLEFKNLIVLSLHPGWVKTDMGGNAAPTEPEVSAKGLLRVIREANHEMSGHFFNFKGEALQW